MNEIDWEKINRINPQTLSEEDAQDIYPSLVLYEPDPDLDKTSVTNFIRIIQKVLMLKNEQVEYLTVELDELAIKQGTEEGNMLKRYNEEIIRLREELEYSKKFEGNNGKTVNDSTEELKKEIIKLQIQNENLLASLKEKEKYSLIEKKENEMYANQIVTLEREKQELLRELKTLQDENSEKEKMILLSSSDFGEEIMQDKLMQTIKQKNKHISQLLEDIEEIENENSLLNTKLIKIKAELSEATQCMSEIAAELSKFKLLNKAHESKESELKSKISSLTFRVEELVEEKSKYNTQLDEYILMFNSKLQEWKEISDNKDEEISKLKNENKKLISAMPSVTAPVLISENDSSSDRLLQQQKQVNELQEELQNATAEINSLTEFIEKLKTKSAFVTSDNNTSQCVPNFYESKIKMLEEKLVLAEADACSKAEEVSNLIIQIRKYELGTFGLPEANLKINKLEKIIKKKEKQLEKLVDITNNLEIKLSTVEEQNVILREKCGLSPETEVDTSAVSLRFKKDEELINSLKRKLQKKEEDLINFKIKYRKMITYLKLLRQPVENVENEKCSESVPTENLIEINKNVEAKSELIINENDALRKGMREILNSIRERNSDGDVEIQSECLERLLEALDSRHISGWYHPAMRLRAQLNAEEGKNDELRNLIRTMKVEEKKKTSELQNAYLRISALENTLSVPHLEKNDNLSSEKSDKEDEKINGSTQDFVQEQKLIEAESNYFELKIKYNSMVADFEKKEKEYISEIDKNLFKLDEQKTQMELLKNQEQNLDLTTFSELKSENIILKRKVEYLTTLESDVSERLEKFKQEYFANEENLILDILKLQNDKSKLMNQIKKLEEDRLKSVSLEKFVSVTNELSNVKDKYLNAISMPSNDQSVTCNINHELEINFLLEEKEMIMKELAELKEKLFLVEGSLNPENINNTIAEWANTLAATEMRELNEKQKCAQLEKVNDALVTQCKELEDHNKHLTKKIEILTDNNLRLEELERDSKAKSLNLLSADDRNVLEEKIGNLEKELNDLAAEKKSIQELFEISQGQCRTFQEWKDYDKILLASQKEEILILQASSDDKAIISKLHHDVSKYKLSELSLINKIKDLEIKLSKLLANNLNLENRISQNNSDNLKKQKTFLEYALNMYQTFVDMRKQGYIVPFKSLKDLHSYKLDLKEKRKSLIKEKNDLYKAIKEYSLKKKEMETQLEGLGDLKLVFQGESKDILTCYNKGIELRLKEARYKREIEFLNNEVSQLKNNINVLNDVIVELEEQNIEREQEWNEKQLFWENAQIDILKIFSGKEVQKNLKEFRHVSTSTENVLINNFNGIPPVENKQATNENEIETVNKVDEKEALKEPDGVSIVEPDFVNTLNRLNDSQTEEKIIYEKKTETFEKEALKMTVESLQSVIEQKENTILRLQNLLKEGRNEYGKSYQKLQEELKALNQSLMIQNRAYNKLKNAVQTNSYPSDNISQIVEKYMKKIQELEEELKECQLNLSSVNSQAFTYKEEVEKWKNIATERLLQVEDFRQRY